MKKTYLLTPGPTAIPEEIYATFARPIIHHRTPEFEALYADVQVGLRYLFQTAQPVLPLACTGTGSMEAAVANLFSPGDRVIAINAGKFGERWTKIAAAFGLDVDELKLERGRALDLGALRGRLAAATPGSVRGVLFQASETATGLKLPTREIAAMAAQAGALSVCDAITACGVFELPMDAWGIDCLITGSQKALMLPPGLAFIALSERGWKAAESARGQRFYFDLRKERKASEKRQTAWSPATSLLQGLQVALRRIQDEGLPATFERHSRLAACTRAGATAIGLELLSGDAPSEAVTAVRLPAGSPIGSTKAIVKHLREEHGITIVGGQDELEGKILRLSHFGYCTIFDVLTALAGLELTLTQLGHQFVLGSGVSAALKVWHENQSPHH